MSKHSLDAFLQACGASGPLTLGVESRPGHEAVRLLLPQPFALIGRGARLDVPLDDVEISRRHAYLQVIAGRVYGLDLRSRNGTYWDQQARPAGWLGRAQTLGVGSFRIHLLQGDAAEGLGTAGEVNPLAQGSHQCHPLPGLTLEFSGGAAKQVRWRMTRLLALIGRSAGCAIRLRDASVARFHCSLVNTPQGVWALDLLSRGGLMVNGARARFALLEEGDHVQIGTFSFRPRPATPSREDGWRLRGPASGLLLPAELNGQPGTVLSPRTVNSGELTPASPGAAGPLGPVAFFLHHPGSAPSVLGPLVRQLGLMQNELFDQFQQSLLLIFQRFSALHGEQMGFLREELERVHEITCELQAVQAELAKHLPAAPARVPDTPVAAAAAGPPLPSKPNSAPSAAARPEAAQEELPTSSSSASADCAPAAGKPQAARPAPGQPEANIHTALCQRLAAMEQERQSRWEKILNFLTRASPATLGE